MQYNKSFTSCGVIQLTNALELRALIQHRTKHFAKLRRGTFLFVLALLFSLPTDWSVLTISFVLLQF